MWNVLTNKNELIPWLVIVAVGSLLGGGLIGLGVSVGAHPVVIVAIVISLCIAALCAYGCTRAVRAAEKLQSQPELTAMRIEVDAQIDLINEILLSSRGRLEHIQHQCVGDLNLLKEGGIRALSAVRRIIDALDGRLEQLLILVNSSSDAGISRAKDIADTPLRFSNNSMDTVAGSELPELAASQWLGTVDSLFSQIERDTKRQSAA